MSTVDEIKKEVDVVKTVIVNVRRDVEHLHAEVKRLTDQAGSGGVATQADLDSLLLAVQGLRTSLSEVDSVTPPSDVPPVETPDDGSVSPVES